mgnify:CR=1 FL=1
MIFVNQKERQGARIIRVQVKKAMRRCDGYETRRGDDEEEESKAKQSEVQYMCIWWCSFAGDLAWVDRVGTTASLPILTDRYLSLIHI